MTDIQPILLADADGVIPIVFIIIVVLINVIGGLIKKAKEAFEKQQIQNDFRETSGPKKTAQPGRAQTHTPATRQTKEAVQSVADFFGLGEVTPDERPKPAQPAFVVSEPVPVPPPNPKPRKRKAAHTKTPKPVATTHHSSTRRILDEAHTTAKAAPTGPSIAAELLGNPQSLRNAIIAQELLSPPMSLRDDEPGWL